MKNVIDLLGLHKQRMKILFVSSEEAPFAKVGGLGEVAFSLPRALVQLGYDARVIIPLYASVEQSRFKMPYVHKNLLVPTAPGGKSEPLLCNVRKYIPKDARHDPVTTYFLENREYYELRSNVYGYIDDRIRFALLSRGCLEFLKHSKDWLPDIIVCADWMSGYLPNFLKTEYADDARLNKIATILSIHNLEAQGTNKPERFTPENEKDDGSGPVPDFFSKRMNLLNSMKRGIMYADLVNTVSPTYAREIATEEYGAGLENLFRENLGKVRGILNGIDYQTNNPATDNLLAAKFTTRNLDARFKNKLALQKRLGLPQNTNTFMMGVVSRITRQKGLDLLLPIIEPFLKTTKSQLVVVGTGDSEIMDEFRALEKKFPEQVVAYMQYEEKLPHLVFAGCDTLLIPSKFEPSGLVQMEAMRYGAIPVARKTGGLADTIDDLSPELGSGTGFLFENMDSNELLIAITRAFTYWCHHAEWKNFQKRAMERDFSWFSSARQYAELFKEVIKLKSKEENKKTRRRRV